MRDQIEENRRGGTMLREERLGEERLGEERLGEERLGEERLREGRTLPRRRGTSTGPRPVRPRVVPVAARPVQPARPGRAGGPAPRGERVLLRTVPVLPPRVLRRRRIAATVGMALLAAAVVVVLGLLADAAAAARHTGAGEVTGSSLTEVVPSLGQVAEAVGS